MPYEIFLIQTGANPMTTEELEELQMNLRKPHDGQTIPPRMRYGIINYIRFGIIPGGFLSAVLCNDLKEAVATADSENKRLLPTYVSFFYNCAPAACWGSQENVREWKDIILERKSAKV